MPNNNKEFIMAIPFQYKKNLQITVARTGGTIKRDNVTKIKWKRLDNSIWKKLRAFSRNYFENFNLLLQTEQTEQTIQSKTSKKSKKSKKSNKTKQYSDKFVNEYYVESFLKFIFGDLDFRKEFIEDNHTIINEIKRVSSKLIDWECNGAQLAVEIFARKKSHNALKKLIESPLFGGKYAVCILNGDTTTDLKCERDAKNFIAQNPNKRVVFIADIIGIRSFSVKQIKNIVLMVDGSMYGTLLQRMGRGLTPYDYYSKCNILDFRTLANKEGMCGNFITGHVERKAREKKEAVSDIIDAIDFDQIMIEDYFINDIYSGNPIRKMKFDEIKNIISQSNFVKKSIVHAFSNEDSDVIKECLKVVSRMDCSQWSKSKPEDVTFQITTNVNNAHGGKISARVGIKPKKSDEHKKEDLTDKEKAINFHLAWFANNYVYVYANYALQFEEHILKKAFETHELDEYLKKDHNLDMRILKVIINNVDKLFYDIIDNEFKIHTKF